MDACTFAWGFAISVACLLATASARWVVLHTRGMNHVIYSALAFLAAFVAYEGVIFATALAMDCTVDFTLAIKGKMFAINVLALPALLLLNRAGVASWVSDQHP